MQSNITVNTGGEQTALQNEKWKVLSEKLFKMPVGALADYAAWLDEFSDVELLMYCETAKFRAFFERWDKPNFDRLEPFFAR